ncbi:MAG: (2Fe-2S)-binding protein, partial [Bacillota bacterium]|nr:(2Fe-2S)-binding protein [Bacillota bacterium]
MAPLPPAPVSADPGRRVTAHPILGPLQPPQMVSFVFDGREYQGMEGEPIAAALLAAGIRTLGQSERTGRPRGVFCGIGHCYECRVTVNGESNVRSCLTPLREGMVVQSQ